jgi:hypothetical protein
MLYIIWFTGLLAAVFAALGGMDQPALRAALRVRSGRR